MRYKVIWLVFAGGALGSLLRALMTSMGTDLTATFLANFLGACALGLVQTAPQFATETKQAFYATGFCGGFTTLSGIALFISAASTPLALAIGYTLATIAAGLIGYWLWARLGKTLEKP